MNTYFQLIEQFINKVVINILFSFIIMFSNLSTALKTFIRLPKIYLLKSNTISFKSILECLTTNSYTASFDYQ